MATIAVGSVVAFWALAYLPHVMKQVYAAKVKGGHDNADPRSTVERLQARKADPAIISAVKRLEAAHHNSLENFGPFAAAVIFCLIRNVPIYNVNNACLIFVAFRCAYIMAVFMNQATLRSLTWTASASVIGYLYYLALKF